MKNIDTEFVMKILLNSKKTSLLVKGAPVYQLLKSIKNLKKSDLVYLDTLHRDHLEVFNKRGQFKVVLDIDGNILLDKSRKSKGRTIKL